MRRFDAGSWRAEGVQHLVGGPMEDFDERWDEGTSEAELELDSDPEELWRSLIADEAYPRYWSESVWSHAADDMEEGGARLFADGNEKELGQELRLCELWDLCESGCLDMSDFFELSALITQVQGLPGSLCVDCEMLGRPNVSPNWALAMTTLCRAHLRFRLGHARIDGGTGS
jgi:hypothetical protein